MYGRITCVFVRMRKKILQRPLLQTYGLPKKSVGCGGFQISFFISMCPDMCLDSKNFEVWNIFTLFIVLKGLFLSRTFSKDNGQSEI